MKFAIPTQNRVLTAHFGHCENFAIVTTNGKEIEGVEYIDPPVHQPGVYPRYLAENGVDVIIAGGMGQKAQDLFSQNNIQVCMGVQNGDPSELVMAYLEDNLQTGSNLCDH